MAGPAYWYDKQDGCYFAKAASDLAALTVYLTATRVGVSESATVVCLNPLKTYKWNGSDLTEAVA